MKPSLPKGTRDFGAKQVMRRRYIMDIIEQTFKKYGFMPLETPAMENLSTLTGKYGDEGDKLLFKILNSGDYLKDANSNDLQSKDHNALTKQISEKGLRYDLTVPLARYVVMNRNDITLPFRRYQMQPVWRADRPQKGRYREFWQCDADVVGSDSLLSELDLLQIYQEVFRKLNIPVKIRINNRKILSALVSESPEHFVGVTVALDKLDKTSEEEVIAEIEKLGVSGNLITSFKKILALKNDAAGIKAYLQELFANNEAGKKGLEEVEFILSQIDSSNLVFDISLARGLGYYTGTIIEVTAESGTLKSSIGGGGRYDDLTGIFGMPGIPGVGVSFGLDRIYDVVEELQLFPENLGITSTQVLFCHFDQKAQMYSLPLLKKLRDAGIAAEIYPNTSKMKKQLDYADALQIPYCAIIGDNEMAKEEISFKNMKSGEQRMLKLNDIIDELTLKN